MRYFHFGLKSEKSNDTHFRFYVFIILVKGGLILESFSILMCKITILSISHRVSVQVVKSLGGHFAFLCRGVDLNEVKKIIIFQLRLHF